MQVTKLKIINYQLELLVKNLKLLWIFRLGLEIWPRHAHFPKLRGAETETLDLRDRDFEK